MTETEETIKILNNIGEVILWHEGRVRWHIYNDRKGPQARVVSVTLRSGKFSWGAGPGHGYGGGFELLEDLAENFPFFINKLTEPMEEKK